MPPFIAAIKAVAPWGGADKYICVSSAYREHKLKLNDDKTEFLIYGTKSKSNTLSLPLISMGDSEIHISTKAKNLGVVLNICVDYCNVLLSGLPDEQLKRLQTVQNYAAKIIFMKKKTDHVTPLLMTALASNQSPH